MYEQVEKPKENKSKDIANSVIQNNGSGKQGFGFVDNRPEVIAQRKLQEMADNYSVKLTQPIQKKENNSPVSARSVGAGIIQCKPNNIKKNHKLKLNRNGEIQNEEAGRVDPPVSYPMNTLIALRIIDHDDVKGGHLFKREYGGPDDYSNVVTWSERSEKAFTVFEDDYLKLARQDAEAANKTVTYKVQTEANFGNAGVTKADLFTGPNQPRGKDADNARHKVWSLTKKSLETVPTSVDVSLNDLSEAKIFSRDSSKMLATKVTPSAANAQTQVQNIIDGVADDRIQRALDRLQSP